MNKIIWSILLVGLTLSGCSTTSDTQATVEDRTASKPVTPTTTPAPTPPAQTGGAAKATGGVETTALEGGGVKGSSLDGKQIGEGGTAAAGDPRKDAASPLAKREIFFDYDSYVVKDEYRPMLEAHAAYLMSHRDARLILQGNADQRGSREYNLALAQKRAEAVRKALAVMGVSDAQLEAVSFGEEKLRNEGMTEEAHAENRRVDLVYADE